MGWRMVGPKPPAGPTCQKGGGRAILPFSGAKKRVDLRGGIRGDPGRPPFGGRLRSRRGHHQTLFGPEGGEKHF